MLGKQHHLGVLQQKVQDTPTREKIRTTNFSTFLFENQTEELFKTLVQEQNLVCSRNDFKLQTYACNNEFR